MDDIINRNNPNNRRPTNRSNYYFAPTRPQFTASQAQPSKPATITPKQAIVRPSAPARMPQAMQDITTTSKPGRNSEEFHAAYAEYQGTTAPAQHDSSQYFDEQPIDDSFYQQPTRKFAFAPVFIAIAIILGGVGIGSRFFGNNESSNATTTNTKAAVLADTKQTTNEQSPPTTTAVPAPEVTTSEEMDAAIKAAIAANPGISTSVAVIDLKSNASFTYGVNAPYHAASVGKVVSATTFLKQVETGSQSLDKTLGGTTANNQLQAMIVESDNGAWEAINGAVGFPALQQTAKDQGMTTYTASTNQMKPLDVATLLQKIYAGNALNETNKKLLFEYMKAANRTDFILSGLPKEGVTAYHKAGWLADRSHDAAIIDNGTNPYVLVVFTKGTDGNDEAKRIQVIKAITNATVGRFIGKEAAQALKQ